VLNARAADCEIGVLLELPSESSYACGRWLDVRVQEQQKVTTGVTRSLVRPCGEAEVLGGADDLDGLWGHHGATEHPQTAANGTDPDSEIPLSDVLPADSREPLT